MGDSSERHDVEDEAGRRGLSAGGAMDQIEDEMEALALSSSVARKAAAAERQAKQATLLSTAIEQAFPVPAPRSVSGGRAQITDAYGRRACANVEHVIIGGEGVTLAFVAVPASNTASSAAAKETERRLAHAILVWCSKHVARLVVAGAEEDGSGKSLRRAGRSFFKEAQATALRDHPKLAKCAAACTLVLCAVNHSRGEVTTCHLGTCVAVLASRTAFGQRASPPTLLSRNHRVQDCAAERARVEKSGGCLAHTASQDGQPRGPLLIWPGGHETARCIGSLGTGRARGAPAPLPPSPLPSRLRLCPSLRPTDSRLHRPPPLAPLLARRAGCCCPPPPAPPSPCRPASATSSSHRPPSSTRSTSPPLLRSSGAPRAPSRRRSSSSRRASCTRTHPDTHCRPLPKAPS